MDLRSQMQRIALRWPAYGYRRVHAQLLRPGWTLNHKRVLRLLRADNLLCVRRRKFMFGTTDSRHGLPIYPNLAAGMVLTSIDQLWVADITYIRLQWEFVYLAVLLDAFSRRCLGWALQRSLESALALEALRMALTRRRPLPGLVHHSDRGAQYASRDYTAQLQQHGIPISMSRLATPSDNAQAESFMKLSNTRKSTAPSIATSRKPRLRSSSFWRKSTTSSACIRRWAIVRRWSSNAAYDPCERWGKDEYEFFEA
jgi:transposase InsO family protein